MSNTNPVAAPTRIHDGLALYATGSGAPLFLMPYPHGFSAAPISPGPLAAVLRELSQEVISFDPPGIFNSIRPAQISMTEMLGCAEETRQALSIPGPFTLAGHSMGGLCAIAYALAYPEHVNQLIIIGSLSGGSAIQRGKGMPWGHWLTGVRLVIFEDSGHYPFAEERVLFKQTLAEFLA